MVYVFYKNHICFFLSVFKKTNTLRLYSVCGGIKTLKRNVRTTMQLAYHGCKNLTHTSKIRHVKRTQMVVTVRFTIRVFLTISDWWESNATKLSREKIWRIKTKTVARKSWIGGLNLRKGSWHFENLVKSLVKISYWFIAFHIQIWKGWAHQCPLDWFKFRLCCHWHTYKEIKSYNEIHAE